MQKFKLKNWYSQGAKSIDGPNEATSRGIREVDSLVVMAYGRNRGDFSFKSGIERRDRAMNVRGPVLALVGQVLPSCSIIASRGQLVSLCPT
jgi:hypothetical protein